MEKYLGLSEKTLAKCFFLTMTCCLAVGVKAVPIDKPIYPSTTYGRNIDYMEELDASVDVSSIQYLLDQQETLKKKEEEEKAKLDEERKKSRVLSGSTYATAVSYSGRFRLSNSNDSDSTIIANINRDASGTPVAGYGTFILQVGKQWNIDPYVLAAIAKQESTYGLHTPSGCPYNFFGRKAVGGGWRNFASVEEAFSNEAGYLAQYYLDSGLITLDSIGEVYCPGQGWPSAVRSRISEIRRGNT